MAQSQRVIFRPLVLDPNNITIDVSNGELYLEGNERGEFDLCYKHRVTGKVYRVASTGEEGFSGTDYSRKLMSAVSAGEFRQILQLGSAATRQIGDMEDQVPAGNHRHTELKNLGIATTLEVNRDTKANGMYSYSFNNFTTNRVGSMTYGQVLTVAGKYGETDKQTGFQIIAGWGADATKLGYRVLDTTGNWTAFANIYTSVSKPTPVELGAVPRWKVDSASSGALTAFSIWMAKPTDAGASLKRALPTAPTEGDMITIRDDSGIVSNTKKITVDRAGRTIMGLAEDMDITTPYQSVTLVYRSGDWRVM